MVKFEGLLEHYKATAATMASDIAFWRKFDIGMRHNGEDVTERWLANKQWRLGNLLNVISAHERNDN
jgi:hypothetical protein